MVTYPSIYSIILKISSNIIFSIVSFILSLYHGYFVLIFIISIFYLIYKYLYLCSIKYIVEDSYMVLSKGVLDENIEYTYFGRIKDIEVEIPFIYSILNLYNLVIYSSDISGGKLVLFGIKDKIIIELVKNSINKNRKKSNIFESL